MTGFGVQRQKSRWRSAAKLPFLCVGSLVRTSPRCSRHLTSASARALAGLARHGRWLCYVTPRNNRACPKPKTFARGHDRLQVAAHAADFRPAPHGRRDRETDSAGGHASFRTRNKRSILSPIPNAPRNYTTNLAGRTSYKEAILLHVRLPSTCRMQTRSPMGIWRIGRRALKAREQSKQLRVVVMF